MECPICVVLEAIRADRIEKYVRLVAELKRARSPKLAKAELEKTMANIEAELNEAWQRLAARRENHPEMAALLYRGAPLDLRGAICIHCAEKLETNPDQR